MEIGCEDGRWMELAQDRVQLWALVLAVLNRCVLLSESQLAMCNIYSDSHEIAVPVQITSLCSFSTRQSVRVQCPLPSGTLHTALFHFSQHFFILCRNAADCVSHRPACCCSRLLIKLPLIIINEFFPSVSEFHVSAQDL